MFLKYWFLHRVSSEVLVSDDEEDKLDFGSFDDSFIDDRINPTATDSQAEAGEVDMIAIYRFLLSSLHFLLWFKSSSFLGNF